MTLQKDKPVIGVVGFNLLTLFVFITAPVDWRTDNLVELCFFVVLCQLLVFIGFRVGWRTAGPLIGNYTSPLHSGSTLLTILFVIYTMTFPLSYAYRMDLSPFDISGMVSKILAGIRDPHFGYQSALENTGGSLPWTAYFAVSIFNQLFFTAGFVQWSQLTRTAKVLFVTFVGIDLFYWVGIATSFGVVSLATTFGLSTMFWRTRAVHRPVRKIAARFILLLVLFAGTIAFFSYNLYRRSNVAEITLEEYQVARSPLIIDHPAFSVVPRALWPTYIMVVSYMGQGYYHTSVAFDLEFRPSGFLSSNPALISLTRVFGLDVWDDTYMHRLQRYGIDEFGVWHSAYTWFASDVSFYGVPIVLFLLGVLFGFSWRRGLHGDFLSRVVFIIFGNVLLFLFANNTYLSSVFYAFMVFVPLWMFTRFLGVGREMGIARRSMLVRDSATATK